MQAAEISKSQSLLDALLLQHKGHPANYCSVDCPVCLFNCAYHIQRRDLDMPRALEITRNISLGTINDAIREVSTALDDYELVKPFPLSGGKQSL